MSDSLPDLLADAYLVMPIGDLYDTRHEAVGRAATHDRRHGDLVTAQVIYVDPDDEPLRESIAVMLDRFGPIGPCTPRVESLDVETVNGDELADELERRGGVGR